MRILIFGGAFDPIHRGHIALLKEAIAQIHPEKTLVIPCADGPAHKSHSLFPASWRLPALKTAFKGMKKVTVSDLDIQNNPEGYAWKTVRALKVQYPKAKFFYLIGSDNYAGLWNWNKAERLFNDPHFYFVAGARRGVPALKKEMPLPRLIWLQGEFPAVSSSEIRRLLVEKGASGKAALQKLLPKEVLALALGSGGLLPRINAYLKEKQSWKRYYHSLCVAQLAVELASFHGFSSSQALLAALLHDSSRHSEKLPSYRHPAGHAGRSVKIARSIFGIRDREVLKAIAFHTVGSPFMGKLARLLYVADYSSYDRKFKESAAIRRLAKRDLKAAFRVSVESKITYVRQCGEKPHPMSLRLLSSLK